MKEFISVLVATLLTCLGVVCLVAISFDFIYNGDAQSTQNPQDCLLYEAPRWETRAGEVYCIRVVRGTEYVIPLTELKEQSNGRPIAPSRGEEA